MKVFIFYGTDCDCNSAWLPYIKERLDKQNITCIIPDFPTPNNQTYKTWSDIMSAYKVDSEDTIIGWSTGAIFAVRYLYENNLSVNKLILVSGFNNYRGGYADVDKINEDFFMKDEGLAKKVANQIVCIKSNNDPFITTHALNSFANNLGAKTVTIAGGGILINPRVTQHLNSY